MNLTSFDDFKQKSLAAGFDEMVDRNWVPQPVLNAHIPPYGMHALLKRGDMELNIHGQTQDLVSGSIFVLALAVTHNAPNSDECATYWVARKN